MEPSQLSEGTKLRVALLFPPEQQEEVQRMLAAECGNNLPGLKDCDPLRLERFQFAVLKLSDGEIDKLNKAISLAKQDWRDLLMAAGFGGIHAHEEWLPTKRR